METLINGLLRKYTLIKKMTFLLVFIIAMFSGIMIYNINLTTRVRDQYSYTANYLSTRILMLVDIQQKIRGMVMTLSNTVGNSAWLSSAEQETVNTVLASLYAQTQVIIAQGELYVVSLLEDPFVTTFVGGHLQEFALSYMQVILGHVRQMQSQLAVHHDAVETSGGYLGHLIPMHATPATEILEGIRILNTQAIIAVSANVQAWQEGYLVFNIVALSASVILIFVIFFPTAVNLKNQIAKIENGANAIKLGDFSVVMHTDGKDELSRISNIMGDVIDTFSGIIRQIVKTANDIGRGNTEARLEESQFEGEFLKAAAGVNMLAEEVMDAASVKAEEEYYNYMQFLMDTVPLVISRWDENLNLVGCNEEAIRRHKLTNRREYFQNFYSLSPPLQPNGLPSEMLAKQYLTEALEKGFSKFEWMHTDKDGALIPSMLECYKTEFMGKTGVLTYASDLRHLYKSIEESQKSALAQANSDAKSRFLARMSHEIRTPISSVLGISEIQLQNPDLPMPVEESFAKIHSSAQILLGIVNDILDLSKIESGNMEIAREEYLSASLINDTVQLNLFRIGSKKIKFEVDIDPAMPVFLLGDELRIKQIASNLLSNSFKYTEEGKVSMTMKFIENENAGAGFESFLYIKVADTGCGMSEEECSLLFAEFSRFNEARHRNVEGIGLGMAIVDNLIRLMGAKVKVQSAVGEGTSIEVEIPQERASKENLDAALIESLRSFNIVGSFASKKMSFKPDPMPYGRVLVVDDIDTNLFVAKGLMSFYNLQVETAASGEEVLALVKSGLVYDIIFMDQMMPGMDGVEAAKFIREAGYANPIVALTANALVGQAEFFMQNGFDGFISKPIDSSHLNAVLNKFVRDRHPKEVVEAARKNALQGQDVKEFETGLRAEFAKSQKDAAKNIADAWKAGDMKSCRRFAHTLKGLAYTVREKDLGDLAAKLEGVFEREETDGNVAGLIEQLGQALALALEAIAAEQSRLPAQQDSQAVDVAKILEDLEPMLHGSDTRSLALAMQLKPVPQAAILVRQIEIFDFNGALASLSILKDIAA